MSERSERIIGTSALEHPASDEAYPTGPVSEPDSAGAPSATWEAANDVCVEMTQVVKRFGDNTVLDHLDLTVEAGQKVVIIGPSGSGKTTILRVLMTLERPEEGHVAINGEQLYHQRRGDRWVPAKESHIRRVRRNVSMVFQHFHLFPHRTVRQNITLGPRKVLGLGKDEANALAIDLLDRVGLADKADEHPSSLSGGQKQRVAIARALAMEPKVMLFDEVTSALDPELVGEVLAVLTDLAQHTSMSMLLVTHEMRFAEEIADRVLMFDEGRIIEDRPPHEMFSDPTEERTQAFLQAVLRND